MNTYLKYGSILILLVIGIVALVSCNKNNGDNNVFQQSHDENAMMMKMHDMMDGMENMTMTHDPDIDFASMMKMHHEGAIEMARLELIDGNDAQIKDIAQAIIDAQTAEIAFLNTWLTNNPTAMEMDMEFMEKMEKMNSEMDRQADIQIITGDVDEDFVTLMIIHHQSAMDMASAYLYHGNDNDLKNLARDIVSAQQSEIEELQNWLLPKRVK